MKKALIAVLLLLPAGAQGMWDHHTGAYWGAMRPPSPLGLHLAVALYALLAALGYWVLQHAARESAASVRRPGKTVGWTLIVTGLLGLLCGLAGHVRAHARCQGQDVRPDSEWHDAQGAAASGPAAPKAAPAPKKK